MLMVMLRRRRRRRWLKEVESTISSSKGVELEKDDPTF